MKLAILAITGRCGAIGQQVKVHIEGASQQTAGLEGSAQPLADLLLYVAGEFGQGSVSCLVIEAILLDADPHRNGPRRPGKELGIVDLEGHVQHSADTDATILHRSPLLEPPHRVIKQQHIVDITLIFTIAAAGLVSIEGKLLAALYRLAQGPPLGDIETHPAPHYALQGAGFHLHPFGRGFKTQSAIHPEADIAGDQRIIGRGDEELILHASIAGREVG